MIRFIEISDQIKCQANYDEGYPIKRFIKLIPDKYFTKQPKSYYLR